ncbi:MAG: DUF2007 domain-containing protein [Myxococcota bacterium]
MADLVEVFRSSYTAEAQIKASVLKDRGIQVVVTSPDLAASVGAGAHILPVRVLVPDHQAELARQTLAALEEVAAAQAPSTGPKTCPNCGATWEPGFAVCWQCQYEIEPGG